MVQFKLYLLGAPRMEWAGAPVVVDTRKAIALLAYLAVTEQRHTRDTLATLFYPEHDQTGALNVLRRTLFALNKALPTGWLAADRETIGLAADTGFWCDVNHFSRYLAQCRSHGHAESGCCPRCLPLLAEAVQLYQGDFMAGFTLRDSPDFDNWQFFQAENLRRQVANVLERLVQGQSAQHNFTAAIDYAQRWLHLDNLHEPAHRALMQLYAWNNQTAAALRQYEECVRLLQQELDAPPEAATTQLIEAIRTRRAAPLPQRVDLGAPDAPTAQPAQSTPNSLPVASHQEAPTPPLNAPTPPHPPFMAPALPPQGVLGREDLLAQLTQLLLLAEADAPDVPPVALHGMGGIGKTTMAIALSRTSAVCQLFPDGVLWASVGPQPRLRHLLDRWGRALGLNLTPERDEAACSERLRAWLQQRRVLLIVDDLWEVAHGQPFMVAGPGCRTLLTTREAPVAYSLATRTRTLRVDLLQPADALKLLYRLAPEAVTADEVSARRLCERLEYLPLALTLAGNLLANEADVPSRLQRLVGELIERRESRLHLLQAEGRPGIEQSEPVSLQAILGMSVARLSPIDQERFALLTIFGAEPLTWQTEAAAYVWECSVEAAETTIAHFIQRALVMRRGESYWMHALLADYAAELLQAMN